MAFLGGIGKSVDSFFRPKWNQDADIARSVGSDIRARLNSPEFRPDASGFLPSQRTGLNVFAKLMHGQSSGDWASRGFTQPGNEDAVVGSALTQAAPNLFAIQNENRQFPIRASLDSLGPQLQGAAINAQSNMNMANLSGNVFMNALGQGWGSNLFGGLAGGLGSLFRAGAGTSTFGRGQTSNQRSRQYDPLMDSR